MDFFSGIKNGFKDAFVLLFLLAIMGGVGFLIYKSIKYKSVDLVCPVCDNNLINKEELDDVENVINEESSFYVDIKGYVTNPGVYLVDSNMIINDVINMAGGLKNNAYTKNINLSKRVVNEMVIIIYSNKEIEESNSKNECICNDVVIKECVDSNASVIIPGDANNSGNKDDNKDNNQSNNVSIDSKVNINSATLEQLMSLNGIGEAKAKAIIEYRTNNGPFKSVEDIKSVSGISESIYEKIKDNITF